MALATASTAPPPGGTAKILDLDRPGRDCEAMLGYWDQTDAILGGITTLRKLAEKYLPKFPAEQKDDYNFRLSLASMTNVFRDGVESLALRPFQTPITITDDESLPGQLTDFITNVDGAGSDLTSFTFDMFYNGIASSIDWIFVDYPNVPIESGRVRSLAEEQSQNIRPFWTHVRARNVLEVRSAIFGGIEELTYMRILEPVDGVKFVRIIEKLGPLVTWKLYKEKGAIGSSNEFILDSEGVYSIGVIPLVPFITGRRNGRTWQFHPPMRDASDKQIDQYRSETGLEYIKTLTAFPMLSGNGVTPKYGPDGVTPVAVPVGPARVLYAPPNGQGQAGSWTFIEPAAASLTFLETNIKNKITELRELVRQPLTAQSGNLTVITTAVAAQKSNSAVQAWAVQGDQALMRALAITALWFGLGKVNVVPIIFKDFDVDGEGGEVLSTLNTMRKNRDLSQHTYWTEMQRRNVLSPDFDAEDETEALLEEFPGDEMGDVDELGNPIQRDPITGAPIKKPVIPPANAA